MKRNAVFRITGDLCFYFAILSIFDSLRAFRLPMAAITVSCFVLGFVIIRCRSRLVRLLLSLLPALCFLLAEPGYLMLFPALGLLYYVLVMTAGAFAMPLDEYRRGYRLQLVIALFFIAANIANSTLYRSRFLSPDGLVYVFLFLFLGVLAMRGMQMGASMDLRWRLSNLLSVVGLPLCAVGASLLLFLFLRFSAPVVAYLFYPIGRFLVWLIAKLFPRQPTLSSSCCLRLRSGSSFFWSDAAVPSLTLTRPITRTAPPPTKSAGHAGAGADGWEGPASSAGSTRSIWRRWQPAAFRSTRPTPPRMC